MRSNHAEVGWRLAELLVEFFAGLARAEMQRMQVVIDGITDDDVRAVAERNARALRRLCRRGLGVLGQQLD